MLNPVNVEKCTTCESAFDADTIVPMPDVEAIIAKKADEASEKEESEDEAELTEKQKLEKIVGKIGRLVDRMKSETMDASSKRTFFSMTAQFRFVMQLE